MSETKELVEELEDLLKEPCFFTDRYISLFTEIKGILEQQAQPSEELVERIHDDVMHFYVNEKKAKDAIRSLLQGKG